jgi:WD40 repeat protein
MCTSELVKSGPGVTCTAFSPDGAWLASGDSEGNLKVWNVLAAEASQSFALPYGRIAGLAFDRVGGYLVSAHHDGFACIWELDWEINSSAAYRADHREQSKQLEQIRHRSPRPLLVR